jgi:hypothetical protein
MTRDPVRLAALACGLLAVLVLAAFPLLSWQVAVGFAAGLLLGGAGPFMTARTLGSAATFRAGIGLRLALLSAASLGIGFLLGVPWSTPLGVGVACFVLAGSAAWASFER